MCVWVLSSVTSKAACEGHHQPETTPRTRARRAEPTQKKCSELLPPRPTTPSRSSATRRPAISMRSPTWRLATTIALLVGSSTRQRRHGSPPGQRGPEQAQGHQEPGGDHPRHTASTKCNRTAHCACDAFFGTMVLVVPAPVHGFPEFYPPNSLETELAPRTVTVGRQPPASRSCIASVAHEQRLCAWSRTTRWYS